MSKRIYRVRNWSDYNKSLVERGNITFWVDKKVLSQWGYQGKRRRGGVKQYSDIAIQTTLVLKELFHMPYRLCEGFMKSIGVLLGGQGFKVPDYTTLCRRAKQLRIKLSGTVSSGEKQHVLIDSTGLHLYGEGEWQRKKSGQDPQRDWLKLHIAVDAKTWQLLSMQVSGGRGYDADYFAPLIEEIPGTIACIYADGAYDKRKCYLKAAKVEARCIIPPQRRAREQKHNRNYENNPAYTPRDKAIRFINRYVNKETGRQAWKKRKVIISAHW